MGGYERGKIRLRRKEDTQELFQGGHVHTGRVILRGERGEALSQVPFKGFVELEAMVVEGGRGRKR